ncbi:MAG: hypothetical protein AAGK25_02195 [Pseudomonadota bacterium]
MKGYIYISGGGADPAHHDNLNDPLFKGTPTLGACMPNIRRLVAAGDYVFVISGKTVGVQQYVVGGFKVVEKISALAAYDRFPENRLRKDENGIKRGNIIVTEDGEQSPIDTHDSDTFDQRIENYLVGVDPVVLEEPNEVAYGRDQTLEKLSSILGRPRGNRVIDVMGRWARMDENQVKEMLTWLNGTKGREEHVEDR